MEEILVRVGEIFLKSEPVLRIYERRLIDNMKTALTREKIKFKIYKLRGRIFIQTKQIEKSCEVLKKVFGIVSFSPCYNLKTSSLREIQNFVKKNYPKWIKEKQKFAARARRVGRHDFTSQDLAKAVGDVIDRKVDLTKPDVEVGIELREDNCYIYTETMKGLGGLPVSTSGKVLCLMSGGIDSPVAAWMMMKRGCSVTFLHFHSFPLVSKKSIEKTKELVKVLSQYQNEIKTYFVPFQKIQTEIKTKIDEKYRIVLYRRFMLRIAEKIARMEEAGAIATGENLAQVSSQTLDNLAVIEEVTAMPVLRPVVGMDKVEIVDLAKKIGTYDISIKPQEDCCTLFVPKHPTTKARLNVVKELEKKLDVEKLVKEAVKNAEIEKI